MNSKIAAILGCDDDREDDGRPTNNIEKKNSNTVEKETLQCDKIESRRD